MSILEKADPQVAAAIEAELRRQSNTLEMIASENHASPAVLEAMGTVLTDKYAEGYPGRRFYCGNENMDVIEQLAIDRAKKLFGAEHANVQPHSGSSANLAVYLAVLKAGDKILGMDLAHGGHLSHGMSMNLSGKFFATASYGVEHGSEVIDMDRVREIAIKERPNLLIVGASAYPRTIDFAAFASIAAEVGCMMMSDMAHIAGLVAAGVHPSPLPCSDFVTTTNHKTLRGPRGGTIFCKKQYAKAIDSAIFPGLQGGPMMHAIAARAVSFYEAMQPEFKTYAKRIVDNAKSLAAALLEKGWRLVSGGTDNHLLLIDLRSRREDLIGHVAADMLASAGIIVNKNKIPFDTRPATQTSGIRLGTPALTTRGMGKEQMQQIAKIIDDVLISNGDEAVLARVRGTVAELCRQFPIPNHRGIGQS